MRLSEELKSASGSPKYTLKQKPGSEYWFVMSGGKKLGGVSKDDQGKFDGTKRGAPEGKSYRKGFDSKESAAEWVAG